MATSNATTVELAQRIYREVQIIRRMNGYTEPDANGCDASIWLGTSLHRIEDLAADIIADSL